MNRTHQSAWKRNTTKERVNAGIKSAKERGVRFGRPPGMTEKTKGKIKEVYRLYSEGILSHNEIARKTEGFKKNDLSISSKKREETAARLTLFLP